MDRLLLPLDESTKVGTKYLIDDKGATAPRKVDARRVRNETTNDLVSYQEQLQQQHQQKQHGLVLAAISLVAMLAA